MIFERSVLITDIESFKYSMKIDDREVDWLLAEFDQTIFKGFSSSQIELS